MNECCTVSHSTYTNPFFFRIPFTPFFVEGYRMTKEAQIRKREKLFSITRRNWGGYEEKSLWLTVGRWQAVLVKDAGTLNVPVLEWKTYRISSRSWE